ncbi:hypothetical protein [Streptomyces axinellae]
MADQAGAARRRLPHVEVQQDDVRGPFGHPHDDHGAVARLP